TAFRSDSGPRRPSAYDEFCAARRAFLKSAIAWIKSEDTSAGIIAQEIKASTDALASLPCCFGKDRADG
ncbi:MAG: hypothetical protein KGJ73_10920, partial [Rhodospirillales bacterium]|nr:hypothetical protein [Rhodospirillales bacterium]